MTSQDLILKAKNKENEGDLVSAIEFYKQALEKEPKNYFLQIELGNLFAMINKFDIAAGYFRRAIYQFPDNDQIRYGLGFCLQRIGNEYHKNRNYLMAQAAFEEAIEICPDNAEHLFNLGNAFYAQGLFKKALNSFEESLQILPDNEAHHNIANSYKKLNDYVKAKKHYEKALEGTDLQIHTVVELIQLKQLTCDWIGLNKIITVLKNHIKEGNAGRISPFTVLSMPGLSTNEHTKVASSWIESSHINPEKFKRPLKKNPKIVIGYISSDFRLHPLYFLIRDVLKKHDKDRFTVKLFYSGVDDGSNEHQEFKNIGVNFFNISSQSDEELKETLIAENIDILVDLSGFTMQSRSLIAAYKPSKISINWLGFPGSMGFYRDKPLMDYILADNFIIPKSMESDYAEKIIRLPGCYQPNIDDRPKAQAIKKSVYGIDDDAFVFASFGQSIKITESMFRLWIKLLKQKDGSILWLLESNAQAENNIHKYAKKEGVDSVRIKFAPKVNFNDHINRHSIIDLFLDTYPYNAHTSSSDAIWAGCPVLTLSGKTFASRVAGSILKEISCEMLITKTEEEYFKVASVLSNNDIKLKSIKEKVLKGKNSSSLFKSTHFVKKLEQVYSELLQKK